MSDQSTLSLTKAVILTNSPQSPLITAQETFSNQTPQTPPTIRKSLDSKQLLKILSSADKDKAIKGNNEISSAPNSAMKFLLSPPVVNETHRIESNPYPHEHCSDHSIEYCIDFPPGPMGLELEPVITSTQRQLGCRIKDFYFREDHRGISRSLLSSKVTIGDIITHINEESVLSMPFSDIITNLREISSSYRKIMFKKILQTETDESPGVDESILTQEQTEIENILFSAFENQIDNSLITLTDVYPCEVKEVAHIDPQESNKNLIYKLGNQAVEAVMGVSNKVTETETAIFRRVDQILPRYNTRDMEKLMLDHTELLQELTQTVYMLGDLKEHEKILLQQIQGQEETITGLSSQVSQCKEEKDVMLREISILYQQQQLQIAMLQEEKSQLQRELATEASRVQLVDSTANDSVIEELSFELASVKEENQHMKTLLKSYESELSAVQTSTSEHDRKLTEIITNMQSKLLNSQQNYLTAQQSLNQNEFITQQLQAIVKSYSSIITEDCQRMREVFVEEIESNQRYFTSQVVLLVKAIEQQIHSKDEDISQLNQDLYLRQHDLSMEIDRWTDRVAVLESQVQIKELELAEAQDKLRASEAEIEQFHQQLEEANQMNSTVGDKYDGLLTQYNHLQSQLSQQEATLTEWQLQARNDDEANQSIMSDIQLQLQGVQDRYQSSAKQYEATITELTIQLDECRTDKEGRNNAISAELNDCKGELERMTVAYNELIAQWNESVVCMETKDSEISELKEQALDWQQQCQSVECNRDRLASQLEQTCQELVLLRSNHDTLSSQCASQQAALKEMTADYDTLHASYQSISTTHKAQQHTLQQQLTLNSELQASLKSLEAHCHGLEERLKHCKEENSSLLGKINSYESELSSSSSREANLTQQLSQYMQSSVSHESAVTEVDSLRAIINQLQAELSSTRLSYTSSCDHIFELNQRLVSMSSLIQEENGSNAKLLTELQQRQQELHTLTAEKDQLYRLLEEGKELMREKEAEMKLLTVKLSSQSSAESELQRAAAVIEDLTMRLDETKDEYQRAKESLLHQVECLQVVYDEQCEAMRQLQEEVVSLKTLSAVSEGQSSQLSSEVIRYQLEYEESSKSHSVAIDQLQQQANHWQSQYQSAHKELTDLRGSYQHAINGYEVDIQQSSTRESHLLDSFEELNRQLVSAKVSHDAVMSRCSELQELNSSLSQEMELVTREKELLHQSIATLHVEMKGIQEKSLLEARELERRLELETTRAHQAEHAIQDRVQEEREELERQVDHFKGMYIVTAKQVDELQSLLKENDVTELSQQSQHEFEKEQWSLEKKRYEEISLDLRRQLSTIQGKYTDTSTKLSKARKALEENIQSTTSLVEENTSLSAAVEKCNDKIHSLKDYHDQLKHEIGELLTENEGMGEQLDEITTRYNDCVERNQSLERRNEILEEELTAAVSETKRYQETLRVYESEISGYESTIEGLESDLEGYKSTIDNLTEGKLQTEKELSNALDRGDRLNVELLTAQSLCEEKDLAVRELSIEVTKRDELLNELQLTVKDLTANKASLEAIITELHNEAKQLQNTNDNLTKQLGNLQVLVKSSQTEQETMLKDQEESHRICREAHDRLVDLEVEFKACTERYGLLKEDKRNSDAMIEQLNGSLSRQMTNLLEQQQVYEELQSKYDSSQLQYIELNEEILTLRQTIASLIEENGQIKQVNQQLGSDITDLTRRNEELQVTLDCQQLEINEQESNDRYSVVGSNPTSAIEDLSIESQQLQSFVMQLSNDIKSLQGTIEQQANQMGTMIDTINVQSNTLREAETRESEYFDNLHQYQLMLTASTDQVSQLQQKLFTFQSDYTAAKQELTSKNHELEILYISLNDMAHSPHEVVVNADSKPPISSKPPKAELKQYQQPSQSIINNELNVWFEQLLVNLLALHEVICFEMLEIPNSPTKTKYSILLEISQCFDVLYRHTIDISSQFMTRHGEPFAVEIMDAPHVMAADLVNSSTEIDIMKQFKTEKLVLKAIIKIIMRILRKSRAELTEQTLEQYIKEHEDLFSDNSLRESKQSDLFSETDIPPPPPLLTHDHIQYDQEDAISYHVPYPSQASHYVSSDSESDLLDYSKDSI